MFASQGDICSGDPQTLFSGCVETVGHSHDSWFIVRFQHFEDSPQGFHVSRIHKRTRAGTGCTDVLG